MPNSRRSRGESARRAAGRTSSSDEIYINPPPVGLDTSSQVFPTQILPSSLSALARHRMTRRRDHDPLGTSIQDTLRELDGQTNALASALEEPLPQVISVGNNERTSITLDESLGTRREIKRRKLEGKPLPQPIPQYEYECKVVPGRLQMCIEKCGVGPYGAAPTLDIEGTGPENVLKSNKSIFSMNASRCNLVLKQIGGYNFSVTKMIIRSPTRSHTSRLQEGMVFVSMDMEGLDYRTERYDLSGERKMMNDDRRLPPLHNSWYSYPAATSVRLPPGTLPGSSSTENRRHNSWQQDEEMPISLSLANSTHPETNSNNLETPGSPTTPYSPQYLDFKVTSSPSNETALAGESHSDRYSSIEDDRGDFLDDLFNTISASSQRYEDQRATNSLQRTSVHSGGESNPPISAGSRQNVIYEGGLSRSSRIDLQGSADNPLNSISESTSSEEDADTDEDEDANDYEDRRQGNRDQQRLTHIRFEQGTFSHTMSMNINHGTRSSENLLNPHHQRYFEQTSNRSRRDDGVVRHYCKQKGRHTPRKILWYPNKIPRYGLGLGPSGVPVDDNVNLEYFEGGTEAAKRKESPLRPHARFFIRSEDRGVTLHFDPPVAGRYILLKLWAPPGALSVDVQEVSVHGFAGPRLFSSVELM